MCISHEIFLCLCRILLSLDLYSFRIFSYYCKYIIWCRQKVEFRAPSCLDNRTYQLSFDFCLLLCQGFGLWTLDYNIACRCFADGGLIASSMSVSIIITCICYRYSINAIKIPPYPKPWFQDPTPVLLQLCQDHGDDDYDLMERRHDRLHGSRKIRQCCS